MKSLAAMFLLMLFFCESTWGDEVEMIVTNELNRIVATESNQTESLSPLKPRNQVEPPANQMTGTGVHPQSERPAYPSRHDPQAGIDPAHGPVSLQSHYEPYFPNAAAPAAQYRRDLYPNEPYQPGASNDRLFAELQQEVRTVVGDEAYGKLVWNYYELKRLDDYIHSSVNQFVDQSRNGSYGLLLSEWLALAGNGAGDFSAGSMSPAETMRKDSELSDNYRAMAKQPLQSQEEIHSLLFEWIKYLTILNFLYLLLAIAAFSSVYRLFRFFLKGGYGQMKREAMDN
ncbi:MAG: hypothetical protein PHH11_03440 [Methylomonas sp.]|nr:hypothetical protein [Methylomonas sp.]